MKLFSFSAWVMFSVSVFSFFLTDTQAEEFAMSFKRGSALVYLVSDDTDFDGLIRSAKEMLQACQKGGDFESLRFAATQKAIGLGNARVSAVKRCSEVFSFAKNNPQKGSGGETEWKVPRDFCPVIDQLAECAATKMQPEIEAEAQKNSGKRPKIQEDEWHPGAAQARKAVTTPPVRIAVEAPVSPLSNDVPESAN